MNQNRCNYLSAGLGEQKPPQTRLTLPSRQHLGGKPMQSRRAPDGQMRAIGGLRFDLGLSAVAGALKEIFITWNVAADFNRESRREPLLLRSQSKFSIDSEVGKKTTT